MRKFTVILSATIVALIPVAIMSPAEAAAFKVTASILKSDAESGNGAYMTGGVTPAVVGKTVHLQRYYSGSWHTLAKTATDWEGKYAGLIDMENLNYKVGSMKFRAKVVGSDGYTSGASSTVTRTIYGWQSLAYMDATYGDSRRFFDGNKTLDIDGNFADDGWQTVNPGINTVGTRYTKWNLQKKCIRLKGFAGIDDSSAADAVGRFIVSVDGTVNDEAQDYSLGQITFVNRSLFKTKYLAIKAYKRNASHTVVGIGEPEVLCSKKLPTNF